MEYQVGDKVVLRKVLVVGEMYGMRDWSSDMKPLADKDYVTIKDSSSLFKGTYNIEEGWVAITNDMIEGLYTGGKLQWNIK